MKIRNSRIKDGGWAKNRFFQVVWGVSGFLLLNHILFDTKPGFDQVNITQSLAYDDQIAEADLDALNSPDAQIILDQKYSYLDEGKQSFAFVSEDEKYVIKFIKTKRIREKRWFCYWQNWLKFSSPLPCFKYFTRKKELTDLCRRYALAYRELRAETALLYVHLNKSSHLHHMLTVIDRNGLEHQIDLDCVPFVIQRKVQLVPDKISELLEKGDIEGAEQNILALKEFFVARAQKGFTDARQVINKNYGFIDETTPIQLDIGKIRRIDLAHETPEKEIERINLHLQRWVQEYYPALSDGGR